MSDWPVLLAMGIVTYATRALPLLVPWRPPHPSVERVLRHMPPAIFAALIVGPILMPGGGRIELGPSLWAGGIGALVAWRTRNMALTIVGGLGAFTLVGLLR
jgi:branched-subunit amino acid transport protein